MTAKYKTFPEEILPCPRLELRWHPPKTGDKWTVDYNLVLMLAPYDIRHTQKNEYSGRAHEKRIRLGRTIVTTERKTRIYDSGEIDTPFRDGVHIRRDAWQLRLPLYAVSEGLAMALMPLPDAPDMSPRK
jgi:hypothetical protein